MILVNWEGGGPWCSARSESGTSDGLDHDLSSENASRHLSQLIVELVPRLLPMRYAGRSLGT